MPVSKSVAIGQTQLQDRVRDVILHGVKADPSAPRNFPIGQAMLHSVHDPPLRGSQYIVIRWTSTPEARNHFLMLSRNRGYLPSPRDARDC